MNIEKLKKLVVTALVSDEVLMKILVLKGGNALNLAYDLSSRGSIDIDFSIESDFTEEDRGRLAQKIDGLLNKEILPEGYKVFEVKVHERPQVVADDNKDFWGGYLVEFKIIQLEKYEQFSHEPDALQRNAIPVGKKNSTKFTIDISKYEYVGKKRPVDMDGSTVYVYSPEMLALEKLRALCQQSPNYKTIVHHMTPKVRARDFFDIHNLLESIRSDYTSEENISLARLIFTAKRVPLSFIGDIESQKEFHRNGWESVIQTINQTETVNTFDFYFEYVLSKFRHLINA